MLGSYRIKKRLRLMKKETTRQIKGIAILLMIFHHFCGTALFPKLGEMWIRIGASCKICVAIYAVLSGYGYFFAKEKTVRYGLKKIWGLQIGRASCRERV